MSDKTQTSAMLDAFRERSKTVCNELLGLGTVASSLGAKSLQERIQRDLVKKLEEDRFHLVVVGEFNHGKSSFVNALLGKPVLAVGVTPTTAQIHHLKYASSPTATVVRTSGAREDLPFDAIRTFSAGGSANTSEIDFIEVRYPSPLLKEGILLVDTPGVNDLSLQRSDITYSYIPRADAVLFLLDAGQILKESERVFLQEKLLKASRDKIVFVITKWDILSDDEKKEAFDYAKKQLAQLVPNPVVFPISAEAELAGKTSESGMQALTLYLTQFLSEERGRIMLDNALGEGLNVVSLLTKGFDARMRSVEMQSDELERRIALLEKDLAGQAGTIEQRRIQIKEKVASIKTGARKDLDRFVDDTIRDLPNVIDSAKPEDLKEFLPAFLEDAFRKWAEAEAAEISRDLEELAETTIALVREDASAAHARVASALGGNPTKIDVQIDTFKYDAGIAVLLAFGVGALFVNVLVGGLLTLAAPILALAVKGRVDAEYKKRAKELAPNVLRQTAEKVAPKLDEMVDAFAEKLDMWVVTAGEELHREVLEVLYFTKSSQAAGARDLDEVKREIEGDRQKLDDVKTKIESLRANLWPTAPEAAVA